MGEYIIIVRACAKNHIPDEKLSALNLIFVSPIINMDFEKDRCAALDKFDQKYKKRFFNFLDPHYEVIPLS